MADAKKTPLPDDEEISVSDLFDDEIEEACAELRGEISAQAARIAELEKKLAAKKAECEALKACRQCRYPGAACKDCPNDAALRAAGE